MIGSCQRSIRVGVVWVRVVAGNESATVATISVNWGRPFTAICDAPFDASAILPVGQAFVRRLEDIHAAPE